HHEWQRLHERWQREYPELGAELDRRPQGGLPADWHAALPTFAADAPIATPAASGKVLAALSPLFPELVGRSADPARSNNTPVAARGACRRTGTLPCRPLPPTPRSPLVPPRARSSRPFRPSCRSWSAARLTSPDPTTPRWPECRCSPAANRQAAPSASACAST